MKPNVELKNVKYSDFASRETSCFEASVYIDGKRVGQVSNQGKGGCNLYYPHELKQRLTEISKTIDKYKGFEFESEDALIGDLLEYHVISKTVARALKTKMFYQHNDGRLMETGKVADSLREKVLNSPHQYLQKLNAKRFITNIDEIVKMLINKC